MTKTNKKSTRWIIAHRGLLEGPNEKLENNPAQIEKTINLGFSAEIDVRVIDNCYLLGHNEPVYEVELDWLKIHQQHLYIHAKDVLSLNELYNDLSCVFYHENDACTLTSDQLIWTYPNGKLPLSDNSIAVLPESTNWTIEQLKQAYGVCTDYSFKYRELLRLDQNAESL